MFKTLGLGTEKYPALTGVRAVGASVVFFDHLPFQPDAHVIINVLAFFFALSGILIVRIYYEQAQLSLRWLGKYFVNRFARIYPVYFLLLTVAVLLSPAVHWPTLLANYTLTHALIGTTLLIQPSWSLTVEECFYVLAPAFMLLARRYGFLTPFAVATLLLVAALALSRLGFPFLGSSIHLLLWTFPGHFAEFFAGVWVALRLVGLEKQGVLHERGCTRTVAGLLGVLVLIGAMVIVYRHQPPDLQRIVVINNFLMPLPIAVLYLGLIRETTILSRMLSGKFIGLLGRASYAFYLLHMLVINHLAKPFLPMAEHRSLSILLTFGITWLLSVLLFLCFEEPVNGFIRRKFKSNEKSVGMADTLFRPHDQTSRVG